MWTFWASADVLESSSFWKSVGIFSHVLECAGTTGGICGRKECVRRIWYRKEWICYRKECVWRIIYADMSASGWDSRELRYIRIYAIVEYSSYAQM